MSEVPPSRLEVNGPGYQQTEAQSVSHRMYQSNGLESQLPHKIVNSLFTGHIWSTWLSKRLVPEPLMRASTTSRIRNTHPPRITIGP